MASIPAPAKCYLLDIAPELRNRIYEHALCESGRIEIKRANWKQPALLLTCKTIRSEAMGIYYCDNVFGFDAINLDSSIMQNFYRHTSKYYDDSKVLTFISRVDREAWPNFRRWLKAYFERKVPLYLTYDPEDDHGQFATAAKAFDIVYDLRNAGNTWSTIEKVLESYKILTADIMEWESD